MGFTAHQHKKAISRRYNGIREASEIECESITSWADKSLSETGH